MTITSKLPDIGTSIFSVMSGMATQHKALNLSQGFPDFAISQELIDRVTDQMQRGRNQYPPSIGVGPLREAISEMTSHLYGIEANPSTEITIFSGATEAIYCAITALIHEGDEVIIFDPAYDSYDPVVRLQRGVPVHINLVQPHFGIPWDRLEESITPRTKAIMINNPHNPTGSIIERADLERLERVAEQHDLMVISDEVYHNMVFDGKKHTSVLEFEGLRRRSIGAFSFGKTFHATGWKVGYSIAPPAFTEELRRVHQFVTFTVNTPIQFALGEFIREPSHYESLPGFFQQKRDFFLECIAGSRFRAIPSGGTYFQVLSYEGLSDLSDQEMAEMMTKEMGLASIPVSVFYDDGSDHKLLRFCFAKDEETMSKAGEILRKV
ncbi:MAG: methionine aminotransferase [Bacteroidota bacterium]